MSSGLNISKISPFLKHISGQDNIIFYALIKTNLIMHESQVHIMGFDFMKEAYKACINLAIQDRSLWLDYTLQEGLLLKNN